VADFPTVIPIFPLPNLVLFPGVSVPLHIFEPRYRQMIADIEQSQGIVGMTLLKGDWERDYHANPDIFVIGCAGKVNELVKLPDGRFNLVLQGLSEFTIAREIRSRSYRQAEVRWCPVDHRELELDAESFEGLKQLLFDYLGNAGPEAWRLMIERQGLRDIGLVNFLCFHLDITPLEKQTLLEARGGRLDCLFDILTFRLEERKAGLPGSGGGSGSAQ